LSKALASPITRFTVDHPRDVPRASGLRRVLALALAAAGAALLVVATFVPVNGGGRSGYPVRIFDRSASRELQLFALEPIGVAAIACLIAVVALVSPKTRGVAGGMLIAFGVQTCLLFLAYLGGAAFGNPEFNSFEAGSALGLIAAVLLVLAGVDALLTRRTRPARDAGLRRM
jgi:hypothetical protein